MSEEKAASLQQREAAPRCDNALPEPARGAIGPTQPRIWLRWRSREKIANRQIDQQPRTARVFFCGWRCGHASNWTGAASSRRLTVQFSTTHGSSRPLTVLLEVISVPQRRLRRLRRAVSISHITFTGRRRSLFLNVFISDTVFQTSAKSLIRLTFSTSSLTGRVMIR